MVRRALNVLGYDLAIVPCEPRIVEEPLPPEPADPRRAARTSEDAGRFHERIGLTEPLHG
jgi:hypothetical protein